MKKRVFSGTRATGRLHLGNYLGAVKGYIALQNDPQYECVYMAVDVHTITTPFEAATLPTATRDIIMDYLAAGLDPNKAVFSARAYRAVFFVFISFVCSQNARSAHF